MALVAASTGLSTIYVDQNGGSYSITPPGTYNLKRSSMVGANVDNTSAITMTVDDGVVLLDLAGISGGISLVCASTVAGGWLQFSATNQTFYVRQFATIQNNLGVTPAILASTAFLLVISNHAHILGTNVIVANADVHVQVTEFGSGVITDDYITSAIAARVVYVHDGSLPTPLPTSTGCTIVNSPLGVVGGSGPSTFRPVSRGLDEFGLDVGCLYFDTTLAPTIPIWWDGAQWIDAAGTGPV